MTRKYVVNKKECAKKCVGRVCQQCGRALKPIETTDNSHNPTYWTGCELCCIFNVGVSPGLYKVAAMMVNNHNFGSYPHLMFTKDPDKNSYHRDKNTGQASDVVFQVIMCIKRLGLQKLLEA